VIPTGRAQRDEGFTRDSGYNLLTEFQQVSRIERSRTGRLTADPSPCFLVFLPLQAAAVT